MIQAGLLGGGRWSKWAGLVGLDWLWALRIRRVAPFVTPVVTITPVETDGSYRLPRRFIEFSLYVCSVLVA